MFIEQIFGSQRPNLEEVRRFVSGFKEDSRIEFKSGFSENVDKNLLRPVVAFANSEGGVLLIGLTDSKRELIGCRETSEQIENFILSRIEPSMAGLFVIESVPLKEETAIILIEVESSPEIHAIRFKKRYKGNESDGYAYYYRNAMSSRAMTPSVLNRIAATKKELKFNFNYRISIFLHINELISHLVWFINFRHRNNIDEEVLAKLSRDYLSISDDYELSLNSGFVKILKSVRLEFLYNEFWRAICNFYTSLLEIERDTPHANLTFEEEISYRMLKRILNDGLGLSNREATFDKVFDLSYIGLDSDVFYHNDLSLFSAKSLFAYLLAYLDPQDYRSEGSHDKLQSFDYFIDQRNKFVWTFLDEEHDQWLTINDIELLFKEFLTERHYPVDHGLFQKANMRRAQYLVFSTARLSSLILKLRELRDSLYANLSLPISRFAGESEYETYLKSSRTTFIYPAHKGLFEP